MATADQPPRLCRRDVRRRLCPAVRIPIFDQVLRTLSQQDTSKTQSI